MIVFVCVADESIHHVFNPRSAAGRRSATLERESLLGILGLDPATHLGPF